MGMIAPLRVLAEWLIGGRFTKVTGVGASPRAPAALAQVSAPGAEFENFLRCPATTQLAYRKLRLSRSASTGGRSCEPAAASPRDPSRPQTCRESLVINDRR